ncbi:hypothetical protein [Aeromonas veronii]|uniref:hypothetical protein n=1 Tax=Aeromonas veronii TaxID=654 RepID=UPI0011167015|nr:hypothetical protein [Aeromonas veronii]
MSVENQVNILLKSWETLQMLSKSNSESAWNLRAWGLSLWSALIAYAYTSHTPQLITISIVLLITVFFIELAIRQIQYQFIKKSIEIEHSINSLLVGDRLTLPSSGISTNISTPSLNDLLKLLTLKRWLIWFPYLLLLSFSILAEKIIAIY